METDHPRIPDGWQSAAGAQRYKIAVDFGRQRRGAGFLTIAREGVVNDRTTRAKRGCRQTVNRRPARMRRTWFEIAEETVALEHYIETASRKRTEMYALGAKQALEWLFQTTDPMNPTRMLSLLDMALRWHRKRPRLNT
jgi:hypothetical protein